MIIWIFTLEILKTTPFFRLHNIQFRILYLPTQVVYQLTVLNMVLKVFFTYKYKKSYPHAKGSFSLRYSKFFKTIQMLKYIFFINLSPDIPITWTCK